MLPSTITTVTAFVDWQSQSYAATTLKEDTEYARAERVMIYVGGVLGRALVSLAPRARFDVELRLYHGWHKGFEVTDRRRALTSVVAALDFASLSRNVNVIIRPNIQYGDNLISARLDRLHHRLGCHLPNTLRWSITNPEKLEEKMVDTALASDLVDLAHRDPFRWLVVFGDDDDLVPPILTADGIRGRGEGRVLLVRRRSDTAFFKISDILYRP